jgi:hypothetical protein
MKLAPMNKKGNVSELPNFFQIMMMVVIFAGLTFIVLEKFQDATYDPTTATVSSEEVTAAYFTNGTGWTLASTNTSATDYAIVALYNASTVLQLSGNYTLTGNLLKNATAFTGGTNMKVNYTYLYDADTTATRAVSGATTDLYDYGIGFLGIIILVVMVYLIISIVSGRRSGAK